MNTKSLPPQLAVAVGQYYVNRLRQQDTISECGGTYEGGKQVTKKLEITIGQKNWDKQGDLRRIDEVAAKIGWGYSAISGTFWFNPKGVKKYTLEVNEETWPLATVKPSARKEQK